MLPIREGITSQANGLDSSNANITIMSSLYMPNMLVVSQSINFSPQFIPYIVIDYGILILIQDFYCNKLSA